MITISEVGPRDGVQSLDFLVDLDIKKRWVAAEAAAGVREIEVGSFVNYKRLPQMQDTAALVDFALGIPGLCVAVLVPNLRGAQTAVAAGVHKLSVPVSASETHSRNNVNRTHDQMIEEVRAIRALVDDQPEGARPSIEVGVATAFGCTMEGHVPERTVVVLAERLMEAGASEVGLSDTTGYADPGMIRSRVTAVQRAVGAGNITGVHLHNTRGLGLANALAALECGLTTLDASLGGLGGCPFAPGASGNIVTEDLVFMLEAMGHATDIDLPALIEVRKALAADLPGSPLYGFVADAGLPLDFAPPSEAASLAGTQA
ncbi:MAG: hydroxymethylglutaryl-CoA lyase [Alphaproteobacteria bacterium]|nr:hydroxymethylglutaryl-CoA lyase [Alphaproteobacteria bacterium]